MKSLWQETALPRFPRLEEDIKTDVLIIGGGIAGLLTAYFLHQSGVKYALAEKDRICRENTQNTTAKITVQHGLVYHTILKTSGVEAAQTYLKANQSAFDEYACLCKGMACNYEIKDNYVYAGDRKKLEKEMRALEQIGAKAEFCDFVPLPVTAAGAVRFPDQAQFDPLKFLAEIAKGLHIYEDTFVREMVGNTTVTDGGKIEAKAVVCATHFPFINKHGSYFLKLYQERSYVIALENAPDVKGMFVDDESAGYSFRNAKGMLLLGGRGGRTGKKCGGWTDLRHFAEEHYPHATERYCWAAQDCMSLDGMPYIGQYSAQTPHFYVETGFNKWGMTSAMLSAMLIRDEILGKKNEFAPLFSPSRSILKPQLFVNGLEAVVSLLTPSKRVCPHMGCALKYNKAEHSWDCPCHGSRFSADGKVLDNPANGDL